MKIAVLTSGGDSPGMNAALRAIARVAGAKGARLVGVEHGYDGLIDGRFRDLTAELSGGRVAPLPEIDAIGNAGGTILGSVRSMRFMSPEGRAAAAKNLDGFAGLLVIGGNGSLTGAHALATEHGLKVIGLPASIDNDIGCTGTAIGVDTALNTIVEACDRISDTARAHRRAFVVEVMGRHCGYLAMASAVAVGADAVMFREQGRGEDALVAAAAEVILKGFTAERGKRRVLIVKAEGVEVATERLVKRVQESIATELPNVDVRGTVLGHLVRGGNPSYQDRMVSGRLAFAAVEALLDGNTDEMVAWQPPIPGGTPTVDPSVLRFPLQRVLDETKALIDGTSPVTKRRVKMMGANEGTLAL